MDAGVTLTLTPEETEALTELLGDARGPRRETLEAIYARLLEAQAEVEGLVVDYSRNYDAWATAREQHPSG
jgi:hypothetical protein